MNSRKPCILIIDDEESLRRSMATKFMKLEYEVLTASNGEEGLEIAADHIPDVIILDLMMPKMNGVEMLTKLRERDLCRSIPVILLSNVENITYLPGVNFPLEHDELNKITSKSGTSLSRLVEMVENEIQRS